MRKLQARQIPDDVPQQKNIELVLGVQRKIVVDQDSAARAERQPFDVLALGQVRRNLNALADGRDFRIAHRQALTSREAAKYASSSDGETRNTSAILSKPLLSSSAGSSAETSTFSPSKSRIALAYSVRFSRCSAERPGSGMRRPGLIERRLEPGDQPVDLGLFRPRHALWRHHATAQLAHHLFPRLGMFAGMIDVQLVQHQPGGFGFFVVAGDAVLIDQCVLRRWCLRPQHDPASSSRRPFANGRGSVMRCPGTCSPSVRYIAFDTQLQPKG